MTLYTPAYLRWYQGCWQLSDRIFSSINWFPRRTSRTEYKYFIEYLKHKESCPLKLNTRYFMFEYQITVRWSVSTFVWTWWNWIGQRVELTFSVSIQHWFYNSYFVLYFCNWKVARQETSPGQVQVTIVSLTPDEVHDLDLGEVGAGGNVWWLGRQNCNRVRPGAGDTRLRVSGLLASLTGFTEDCWALEDWRRMFIWNKESALNLNERYAWKVLLLHLLWHLY